MRAPQAGEEIVGADLDGTRPDNPNAGKNPHAVALGKLGGAKGCSAGQFTDFWYTEPK